MERRRLRWLRRAALGIGWTAALVIAGCGGNATPRGGEQQVIIEALPATPTGAEIDAALGSLYALATGPFPVEPTPTSAPAETPPESALRGVYRAPGAGAAPWMTLLEAAFGAYAWEAALVMAGPTSTCGSGESGGDPGAYNAGNYGLMQINYTSHVDKLVRLTGSSERTLLYDPAINIAIAAEIWRDSSWGPWSCKPW